MRFLKDLLVFSYNTKVYVNNLKLMVMTFYTYHKDNKNISNKKSKRNIVHAYSKYS